MHLDFGNSETFSIVLRISELIRGAGGRALLVGGCVRDALGALPVKDFDIEAHHLNPETLRSAVEAFYPLDLVGMSFGVFKVRHHEIDLALPRTENKTGRGHRGFLVTPEPDLSFDQAAARRDFTVNAIMYDPLSGELIDPWNGIEDLEKKILRHVSVHFSEDPLRVLRAMQFVGRFGFSVAPETVELCRKLSQDELPAERVGTEWEKLLLKGKTPSLGLRFLAECGWVKYYPELSGLPENKYAAIGRSLDAAALRRGSDAADNLTVMSALLCQYGTDVQIDSFLSRLWNRKELPQRVAALVRNCGIPSQPLPPDGTLRRLALETGRGDLLCRVAEAIAGNEMPEFRSRMKSLNIWNTPPLPLLQGRHLLERGIAPGAEMGKLLARCFEAQLDGKFSTLDDGLTYLDRLLPASGRPEAF